MDGALSRFEKSCPDCDGRECVDDIASGDLICKQCGVVLESHAIDERSEWRTFTDSDKTGSDPNRVGAPVNPYLPGGGLSTVIGKVDGDGGQSYSLGRLNARANQTDRALVKSFADIGAICDKLSLAEAIRERSCEIYKEYKDLKSFEKLPRTFKEINAAAPEASKKEIARCFRQVINEMQDTKGVTLDVKSIHPSDFMRRFGSKLGFTHEEMTACVEVANAAIPREEVDNGNVKQWDGRSPISIAASIIYLISLNSKNREPGDRVSLADISEVTQVSEPTIVSTSKDLKSDINELLPVWFVYGKKKARKLEERDSKGISIDPSNKRPHTFNP